MCEYWKCYKFTPWLRIQPSRDKIHGSSCTLTKAEGISPRGAADRCFRQNPPQSAGHSYLSTQTLGSSGQTFIWNQMTYSISEHGLNLDEFTGIESNILKIYFSFFLRLRQQLWSLRSDEEQVRRKKVRNAQIYQDQYDFLKYF